MNLSIPGDTGKKDTGSMKAVVRMNKKNARVYASVEGSEPCDCIEQPAPVYTDKRSVPKPKIIMERISMKKTSLIVLVVATSFFTGFTLRGILAPQGETQHIRKVTGIGGIFFKCKDPGKIKKWYQEHLGLNTNTYGAVFEWYQGADSTRKGFTQWSPFKETTKYFLPSTRDFMINYRVENLEALVEDLKQNGVTVVDTIEAYDYGKFVHVLDIEGNKLELWEPDDIAYEQLGKTLGSTTTK